MDIKEWNENDAEQWEKFRENSLDKFIRGEKINIIKDLCPELNIKDNESYTTLRPGNSLEQCEQYPGANLGFLLGSGLYDKIIIPLQDHPDKATFEMIYGLSKHRGSRLTFEQFLNLIKDGKFLPIFTVSPKVNFPRYYHEILKQYPKPPIFPSYRISSFNHRLKLISLANEDQIDPSEGWTNKVVALHPELDQKRCIGEIKQIFGEHLKHYPRFTPTQETFKETIYSLASDLVDLRILGFERVANLSLKYGQLNKELGIKLLQCYSTCLTSPITRSINGFSNYTLIDVHQMAFLRILPESLKETWTEALSSSPAVSSVSSPKIELNTVSLKGTELLNLIEELSDDENAKDLRHNLVNGDSALSQFDLSLAEKRFDRVDQIITENINREVKGYERKGRIAKHTLRLGKTFTSFTGAGLTALLGIMASQGRFEWLPLSLVVGVSTLIREKLGKLTPEDIVRWWSTKWPFKDPGVGFVLWDLEQTNQNRRYN